MRDAIVQLGDAAVDPLASALSTAPLDDRRDIAVALGSIADSSRSPGVSDRSRATIRSALLDAAKDDGNLRLRAAAIQGLMSIDGDDIAATMKVIYETDRQPGGGGANRTTVTYPAMSLAREWLTRHGRQPEVVVRSDDHDKKVDGDRPRCPCVAGLSGTDR